MCHIPMEYRSILAGLLLCAAPFISAWSQDVPDAQAAEGIKFECSKASTDRIARDMKSLFASLHIDTRLLSVATRSDDENSITYTLNTAADDTSTLDLIHRPEYWINEVTIALPQQSTRQRKVRTVSQKEILIAMMQHGRLTVFNGQACSVHALQEHIELRQHIVAYAEELEFSWPNGKQAKWNKFYWNDGLPRSPARMYESFRDMFVRPNDYSIGCYAAIKATYTFAILDFYHSRKNRGILYKGLIRRLQQGQSPLQGIEPEAMWRFEEDFDQANLQRPGKLLKLSTGIAKKNFIPGDWAYFLNTDPLSSQSIGYEGSNAIYLGRGNFVDFYNDVEHRYTYEKKLDEVYQWRHGVYNRSEDFGMTEHLDKTQLETLSNDPESGGMVLNYRAVPYFYGHETLPRLGRNFNKSGISWSGYRFK